MIFEFLSHLHRFRDEKLLLFGSKHWIAPVVDDRGGNHHAPDRPARVIPLDSPHQAKRILHCATGKRLIVAQ